MNKIESMYIPTNSRLVPMSSISLSKIGITVMFKFYLSDRHKMISHYSFQFFSSFSPREVECLSVWLLAVALLL